MKVLEKPILAVFGLRIQLGRKARGMNRATLSKLAQITTSKLVLIETGRCDTDITLAYKLAYCLAIPLTALL